jgi:hypothetical protein
MKTSSRSIAAKAARRGGEAGSSPRKRAVREVLTGAVCAAIGVALCAILGRAVVLGLLLTGATPAQAAQSADSAAVASPAATESTTWPRDIPTPDGTIRMFEPQVESLVGDTLVSRAAISLTRPGGNALAVFGAVRFTAKIRTEGRAKSAALEQVVVTRVLLPDLGDAEEARVRASLEGSLAKLHPTIATDRLASAVDSAKGTDQGQPAFGNAPPRILVSKQPAVLMLIDGKPERRPIEGTNLEQIVNTPFAVIYQPSAQRYFTSNGRFWYSAIEPTGPWTTVPEPPVEIAKAVAESRQKAEEARRAVGGTSDAAADAAGSSAADGGLGSSATAPAIVVSTEPAELLVFGGEPSWAPLTGTDLLVAMNTPSDVFVEISTQRRFVLLAGRWFVAQSLDGPWSFVAADQLPADFATIPPETAKAYVRASVAGTPEAQDAVLQTQIPQTTAIDRRTAKLDVSYDGAPRFEAIPGTEVAYAVNSGAQVLKIHDRFFAVDQGVWFTAPGPDGPWEVADQRPPEVESIPPSSPVYNTRYVYVYDSTPEYVQVGYLPGYVGSYVYGPTVVYGTGYRYRPWYGASFYARPYTWGFGVRYVPWWGYTWFDDPYSDFLWVGWGWGSSHHHHHHHHDCPPGWYGPAGPRPVYRPPPTYRPPPQPGHVPPPPSSFSRGPRPPAASHNLYVAPRNLPRVAPVATQQPRSYVAPATTPARPSYPASMRPSPSTRPSVTPAPAAVPGASQPRSQPPSTYVPPSSTPSSKPGAGWSTPSHKPPSVAPRPGTPSPAAPRSPLPPSTPAAPPSNFGGANREGRDGGDGRSTPDGAPDARPGYTPPSLPRGGAATPGSGGSFPSQPRSQPWSPNVEPRERRAAPIDRGEDARPSSAWLPRARPAAGWSQPEPRYQPRYEPRVEEPVIDRGTAVADPRYVPRGNRQTVEASRSYPQREVAPPRAIQSSNQGGRGGWSGRSTQVEEARVAMPSMRAPEPERIRVPPPEPQPVAERSQPRGYSAPAAAERPAPRSFEQRAPSGFMPSSRPMPSYGAPSANRGGNPPRHR